jgi:hypothetical protein
MRYLHRPRVTAPAVVTAMVTLALMALTVSPAGATTPLPAPDRLLPATSSLGSQPATGRAGIQAEVSPSGCRGQSNNPHKSGHVPGMINAESRTYCNNAVPSILAQGTLLRFVSGAWTVVGFDTQVQPQRPSISAFSNEPFCSGTSYYALNSFHEVTDVDFLSYIGFTGSPVVAITCS